MFRSLLLWVQFSLLAINVISSVYKVLLVLVCSFAKQHFLLPLVPVGCLGQRSEQPRGPRQARRSGQAGQRNTLANRVLPQTSLPQAQEEGTVPEDSGQVPSRVSVRSTAIVCLTYSLSSRAYQRTSRSPSPTLLNSCWRGSMSRCVFISTNTSSHSFSRLHTTWSKSACFFVFLPHVPLEDKRRL